MINKPQHSAIENSLNLIHVTSHDSNYSTDEGDYSALLYVYVSIDRFDVSQYGNSEELIPFASFVSEVSLEQEVLKKLFNSIDTYHSYHEANEGWNIAIWNDYEHGRSIRIDELTFQERKDEFKNINFDDWLQNALKVAIFI